MAGLVGTRRPGTQEALVEEEEEEEEDCDDCVVPFEESDGEEEAGEEGEAEEEAVSGGQISGSASRIDTSLIRGGKVESQQWTGRRGLTNPKKAGSGREAVARLCERLPCLGAFAVMEMGAEIPGLFEG